MVRQVLGPSARHIEIFHQPLDEPPGVRGKVQTAAELGIARERIEAQKAALIEELKEFHGVTPEMLKERSMKRSLECV